jgi:hypothetical protein
MAKEISWEAGVAAQKDASLDPQIAKRMPTYPPPLPKPVKSTGDAALDAALAELAKDDRDVLVARKLAKKSKHRDPGGALLAVMDAAADGFVYYNAEEPPDDLPKLLSYRACAVMQHANDESFARSQLLEDLMTIVEGMMTPAVQTKMIAMLARPGVAEVIADSLLGMRYSEDDQSRLFHDKKQAPRAVLAKVAKTKLAEQAAHAAWLLDPHTVQTKLPDKAVSRLAEYVDFDADPDWVAALAWNGVPSVLLYAVYRTTTLAPLLALLPFVEDDRLKDLLDALKTKGDPAAGPVLRAYAASHPASAKLVLAAANKLGKPDAPEIGVGTDGGPILLVDATAAKKWTGARGDGNDYERACKAADRGCGFVDVAGTVALVLPEQRASYADGVITIDADEKPGRFKKLAKSLMFAGGALLLDAAYPVKAAPEGAVAKLPLKGTYTVEASARAVRLTKRGGTAAR